MTKESITIPVKVLTDLEGQTVPTIAEDAVALARFYNPLGAEDYYLVGKKGDSLICLCREKNSDKYISLTMPITEITGNPALQQDIYFKPQRIGNLKFQFGSVKFAEGGEVATEKEAAPTNFTSYLIAVEKAMADDGSKDASKIIDENIELVNKCFKDGLSYQYTSNRLLGKVINDSNFDLIHFYFYKPESDEVEKRFTAFDKTDKNLTVIREKEAITQNHVYEELAELSFLHPVILTDEIVKKLLRDIHSKTMTEGDICLMVYNFEKPKRNFKMILFGKKYLLTKYALQLKSIVFASMHWLGLVKDESEIKCAIKQPA